MRRALSETVVEGIQTTIPAHEVLLAHPDFADANHSTKWVETDFGADAFGVATTTAPPAPAAPDEADLVERTVPVEVDGKRFSVKVWLPDAPVTVARSGGGAGAARRPKPAASGGGGGSNDGTLAAPMQGTIVKIVVTEGDTVEVGDEILVLEAMKMENHLNAERAGTVQEIRVKPGDTVGTGDVLVVIA
jgi:acetyl-CoA/propionyl-CoA carboxylase biotin carboxyl carrier protein